MQMTHKCVNCIANLYLRII